MKALRKKIFAAAGYSTTFFGPGRKEFDPRKPLPPFEGYLRETAGGTMALLGRPAVDEGVIASFMAGRFLRQGNLPGFLPFMVQQLLGKACTAVEGACGSGGRAIAVAARSILADSADAVFVAGFEMQNSIKSVYGADVLAGAAYYSKERREGFSHFFPGLFAERAAAYFERYGHDSARRAMARWYQLAVENARRNPKAQEYQNTNADLFALGMTAPDPGKFVPCLNLYDCSKVSDGASSLVLFSEEGLERCGVRREDAVEIIAIGEAQADITQAPADLTKLSTTELAASLALHQAGLTIADIAVLELHDCFSITALLALEAIGVVKPGEAAEYILAGNTAAGGALPTNLSGGLCGFGHPTGASGVRQLVDLQQQLCGSAPNQIVPRTPFGLLVSMGGNDKTVTSILVKKCAIFRINGT